MKRYFSMGAALLTVLVLALSGCDFGSDEPQLDVVQGNLCTSDSDCDGGGVCDLSSGTCVGCVSDSDCAAGRFCNVEKQQCVACVSDDSCATGVCDEGAGICIECKADSDCASGQCDESTGVCLECGADSDCATGNPCEVGACMQGQCIYGNLAQGVACNDGDPCTLQDSCVDGECIGGILDPNCEIPVDPCEELGDGAPCDDGDPCTLDDFCFGGLCVGDTVAPECLGEDIDADGFSVAEGDCDDLNPEIHPGAVEVCDGLDNDCNGIADDGCQSDCVVSGCSAEICASEPMDSDCMWLPEYECLKFAICGPYSANGSCGWLETPQYVACMENIQQPCTSNMDCAPGQVCMNGMCLYGDNQCETEGGECFPYNDMAMSPTQCPVGMAQVDFSGCTADEICCLQTGCLPEVCGDGLDNDCDGMIDEDCPVECIDLSNVNFGVCMAIIGVGFVNGQCMGISGCSCGEYCSAIFETIEECKIACDVSVCANVLCDDGFVCDPATGVCVPTTCANGMPCEPGFICDPATGECVPAPCADDADCPDGLICDAPTGTCVPGVTGCFADNQCAAGQYCFFSNCAVETGECIAVPTMCPQYWSPVCACNGETYGNICQLQASKQDLDHPGECGNIGDADGDGFPVPEDCDDYNAQVFPGAQELCDGMDNDCDGEVDETCGQCVDLSNVNFGDCEMILGIGLVNGQCQYVSGCGCGNYCDAFFQSMEACKTACGLVSDCMASGAFCEAQLDPTFPPYCPNGSAEVDLGGCGLGEICCMPTTYCASNADCPAGEVCENAKCVANPQYCWVDEQCAQGSYCYYSDCAVETGVCQVMPVSCPYLWDPVCSCENVTYANLCVLQAQAKDLKHQGQCTTNPTCQSDADCEPWQACVNGVCYDLPD